SKKKVYEHIDKMGFNRSRVSILAALMRLRQVCCDPRLLKLPPGTMLPPSAKLQRFSELVDDLVSEGHRALVFSQFTEMLEILKRQADEKKLGYLYLDGRTKDRMGKVDAFNAPTGPPIFFISLKAGGTGLNLTAADYVIHYDPWWNPAVAPAAAPAAEAKPEAKEGPAVTLAMAAPTVGTRFVSAMQSNLEMNMHIEAAKGKVDNAMTSKESGKYEVEYLAVDEDAPTK